MFLVVQLALRLTKLGGSEGVMLKQRNEQGKL